MLCTLADVKDRISESDSDYDDTLNSIIPAVTEQFENICNRPLIVTAQAETEYLSGGNPYIQLSRYPVVDVTSIKIAYDYDFDSVDALTNNEAYRILNSGKKGVVKRRHGIWAEGDETIQAVYRGGYCAAGVAPTGNEVALPADLREAAIQQVIYLFKRKSNDIGLSSQTFEDGGFQKHETGGIIKSAMDTLKKYRRITI